MKVLHPYVLCTAQNEFNRDKYKGVHVEWGQKTSHFNKSIKGKVSLQQRS